VNFGDELDFVEAAVRLALAPDALKRMRQAAPASVAHLAWDAVYDAFVDTLSGVVEQHGRPFSAVGKTPRAIPLSQSNA